MKLLSFGGGVQSTAILKMSLAGDLPALDAVLFADTGNEPGAVYRHVTRIEADCAAAGLPFCRVSKGDMIADALSSQQGHGRRPFASMPLHVINPDGTGGILRRQCTSEYKVRPLQIKTRELLAAAGEKQAELWIGISLDEIQRMKESRVKYVEHSFPLIDLLPMTRHDCLRWLDAHGEPLPPKSACRVCPFHSDAFWREQRDNAPEEFAADCDFDDALRDGRVQFGKAGLNGQTYLHKSRVPLRDARLDTPEQQGQTNIYGFLNECSGYCGY